MGATRADVRSTEKALVKAAAGLPGVSTAVACAGTALESRTFVAGKKTFLFVATKDARLKLADSVDQARAASTQAPAAVRVGSGGWTTIALQQPSPVSASVLAKWVAESHALVAGAARQRGVALRATSPRGRRPR